MLERFWHGQTGQLPLDVGATALRSSFSHFRRRNLLFIQRSTVRIVQSVGYRFKGLSQDRVTGAQEDRSASRQAWAKRRRRTKMASGFRSEAAAPSGKQEVGRSFWRRWLMRMPMPPRRDGHSMTCSQAPRFRACGASRPAPGHHASGLAGPNHV